MIQEIGKEEHKYLRASIELFKNQAPLFIKRLYVYHKDISILNEIYK